MGAPCDRIRTHAAAIRAAGPARRSRQDGKSAAATRADFCCPFISRFHRQPFMEACITSQIGEILVINGKARTMDYCPDLPPEPHFLIPTTIRHVKEKGPDKRITHRTFETWTDRQGISHMEEEAGFTRSTACWCGYIGTWELKNDHLFLTGLRGRFRLSRSPLFADWVTGFLWIKLGPMLEYVHMGFGSVHARELQIHIESGLETGRRLIDNRGKHFDEDQLAWANLPGGEYRFPGDGMLND
jgi:hypothetical protein